MNRTALGRLGAVVLALVVVAVVGVVAYHVGTGTFGFHPMMRGTTFRGFGDGMGYAPGVGLFGLLVFVVAGLLVLWLILALVGPRSGASGPGASGPGAAGPAEATTGDLERLRELSDLHTAGKLTDEEFTAAKRKLLGL